MPIPTKDNPRRYTVTTKVTASMYKALQWEALLEYDGNLSRLVYEIIQADDASILLPEHIYQETLRDKKKSHEAH